MARDRFISCDPARLVQLVVVEVAHAPRSDLAAAPELVERRDRLFERMGSAPVQQVGVEMIRSQALQARLAGLDRAAARRVVREDLADQERLVAAAFERLADDPLHLAVAVHLRGVDVPRAGLHRRADRRDGRGPLVALHFPRAEPDDGDLRPVGSERSRSHGTSLACGAGHGEVRGRSPHRGISLHLIESSTVDPDSRW
jgi:hypothetical protein